MKKHSLLFGVANLFLCRSLHHYFFYESERDVDAFSLIELQALLFANVVQWKD